MKKLFKTKALVILSIIIVIGLIAPFYSARAFSISALAANIAFSLIAVILQAILLVAFAFTLICSTLLQIVTGPSFITVPYTSTSEGIIAIGWPIVRDFANLGFALALLFIGLGTALDLEEYQAKKTLPILIAMALLVNFTPVIAGLIVDASNIVMNFFLQGVGDFGKIFNLMGSHFAGIGNKLKDFANKPVGVEIIAGTLVLIIFYVLAGFFFLLYSALFIIRYVAIWTLVIVSPLAFFANILPQTKRFYKQWWNQFINWCIIGIPAAFFLYLSWHLIDQADNIIIASPPGTWVGISGVGEIISSALVYGVVLLFLFIGFLGSLSSSASGSGVIISAATKGVTATMSRAGKWAGSSKFGKSVLEKASNFSIGKQLEQLEGIPVLAKASEKLEGSKWGRGVKRVGRGVKRVGRALAAPGDLMARELGQRAESFVGTDTDDIDKLMESPELKSLVKAEKWNTLAAKYKNPLASHRMKIAIATLISKHKGEVGFENMGKVTGIEDIDVQSAKLARIYSPKHLKELLANAPTLAADPAISQYSIKPRKWALSQSDKHDAEKIMADPRNDITPGKAFRDILNAGAKNEDYIKIADKLIEKDADWRDLQKIGESLMREGIIAAGTDIDKAIKQGAENADYRQMAKELAMTRAVRGLKLDAIPDLSRKTVDNETFQRVFMKHKANGPYLRQFGDSHGSEYVNKYNDVAANKVGALELAMNNPQLLTQSVAGIYQDVCDEQIALDPKTDTTYTDPTTGTIITKAGAKIFSFTDPATGTTSFSLGRPLTPDHKPLMINSKELAKEYITYINKYFRWKKEGAQGEEPERPGFMTTIT